MAGLCCLSKFVAHLPDGCTSAPRAVRTQYFCLHLGTSGATAGDLKGLGQLTWAWFRCLPGHPVGGPGTLTSKPWAAAFFVHHLVALSSARDSGAIRHPSCQAGHHRASCSSVSQAKRLCPRRPWRGNAQESQELCQDLWGSGFPAPTQLLGALTISPLKRV